MTVTLYYSPASPPSRSVLLTLHNLGVEFDIRVINLAAGEHKSEEFTKLNPQQKVPTVDDDGFVMWESRAIMAYLVNEKSPDSSLYPADTKKRFVIDQRLFYDATVFSQRCVAAISPVMRSGATVITHEQKENILSSMADLEGFLEGHEWFSASEDVSIADLSILPTFATIFHLGVDVGGYSNLAAWYDKCSALPGFTENEDGAKMLAGFINSKLTEPF